MRVLFLDVLLIVSLISAGQNAPMNKEDGMKYLQKFGYMLNGTSKDEDFAKSLKEFQKTYDLPMTGELDEDTVKLMEKSRCGHPDKQEIRFDSGVWNKNKLSFKFRNYPFKNLDKRTAIKEMSKAFNIWSQHIPLSFKLEPEGKVDIDISFYSNGDGPGKTLAYAYFPRVGDMYFDNEEWTTQSSKGINLLMVAAHEIGHSLGLEHSNNRRALMFPYIGSYQPNFQLYKEDISRIQELYGKRKTVSSEDICKIDKVDSVLFSTEDRAVYLIKDNNYWKLQNGKLQPNYPKTLSEKWPDVPSSVNAVYNYKNYTYFHENNNIWKHNFQTKETNLDRANTGSVDAGEIFGDRLYLFKGSEYWRFDNFKSIPGYPKSISSFWTGIPNSLDAAYYENIAPYKYFYFFKESTVYKFNIEDRKMTQMMTLKEYLSC